MKIAVATLYNAYGGSTVVMLAAARALRAEHEVTVRAPLPEADSIITRALPSTAADTLHRRVAIIPALSFALVRETFWLVRQRPDVIYVHDEPALYVYGFAGRLLGIPVVWHVHQREGAGFVRHVRDALCTAKIFISRFGIGTRQARVFDIIRNPVEIPNVATRIRDGVLRLGVIGSLSHRKNQILALDTLSYLVRRGTNASLDLYGDTLDPGLPDTLRARAQVLGVERRLRLHSRTPVADALADIDVVLVPSLYENQPLVLLEALAAARAVVASDIEGHREIAAILGTQGLVLAPLSAAAFATAAMSANSDASVGQLIADTFGPARFADAVVEFFRSMESRWQ